MNVYSELLELLTPERKDAPAGLFGTLTAVSPLTVTVRGTALTEGLFLGEVAPKMTERARTLTMRRPLFCFRLPSDPHPYCDSKTQIFCVLRKISSI